jgi:hypothetical protein
MLIILDDSLIDGLGKPNTHENIISVIQDAANAYRKGTHFLFASNRSLNFLRKYALLSSIDRGIYNGLYNQSPQLGSLLLLPLHFCIVAEEGEISKSTNGNIETVIVPVNSLSNKRFLGSPPVFLAENLMDIKLYKRIAEFYLHKSKLGNLRIECSSRGGGGSTISREFKAIQTEKEYLCLCISESDKTFPNDSYGGTARDLLKAGDKRNYFAEIIVLDQREIENLLPKPLISLIINGSPEREKSFIFLNRITKDANGAAYFLDYKRGFCIRSIIEAKKGGYSLFWKSCLLSMNEQRQCLVINSCPDQNNCDCNIMPGFGKNLLENSLRELDQITNHKLAEMIEPDIEEEYLRLGKIITAWFCAPSNPIFAI